MRLPTAYKDCDRRHALHERQVLAAGANAVAAVRSPKTSTDLQNLQIKYPKALTIVAMDTSVFSSVKVRFVRFPAWPMTPTLGMAGLTAMMISLGTPGQLVSRRNLSVSPSDTQSAVSIRAHPCWP